MSCMTPIRIESVDKISGELVVNYVPCGKCEECLKLLQSFWCCRLMAENLFAKSSFFVTLTYDTPHLPLPYGVSKTDVQKFLKRLRKMHSFRYFLVSEYGGIHGRPHYHAILFFNEPLTIIQLSRCLECAWPLGKHNIGYVDISTISYCAKYCLKPRKDPLGLYWSKTFSLMSRKPGLGLKAFNHIVQEIIDENNFQVSVAGQRCFPLPRYIRDNFKSDDQKVEHALKVQEKYQSQNEYNYEQKMQAYEKRLDFERRQKEM